MNHPLTVPPPPFHESITKYTHTLSHTVPLACGIDPKKWCERDWGKCLDYFNQGILAKLFGVGCVGGSKHFYFDLLSGCLPEDAHIRCSGRLYLSVTLFPSLENKIISHFETKDELIWAWVATMALPFAFIGDFPIDLGAHGKAIDGGFSNDAPCLDSYTITVSALHNKADVSPRYLQNEHLDNTEFDNPISFFDVVRTPDFDRVWKVAAVGEAAARKCDDFNRPEWLAIKKPSVAETTAKHPMKTRSREQLSEAIDL